MGATKTVSQKQQTADVASDKLWFRGIRDSSGQCSNKSFICMDNISTSVFSAHLHARFRAGGILEWVGTLLLCLHIIINYCSLGQSVLRKIFKSVTTRWHLSRPKCTKLDFSWGSAPDPAAGAYSAPPDSLPRFEGAYF